MLTKYFVHIFIQCKIILTISIIGKYTFYIVHQSKQHIYHNFQLKEMLGSGIFANIQDL